MKRLSRKPSWFTHVLPMLRGFAIAVALFGALDAAHSAAEGPESVPSNLTTSPEVAVSDQIEKWINELNHDAFTVRQSAAAKLLAAGTPARDALVAVAEGPHPETRATARRLVALIDRSEFNRRLEAFAADTTGRLGLSLPGWQPFRELVGGDPAARALFVEMQRAEGPMLAGVFGVPSRSTDKPWEERLMRLVQWQAVTGNRNIAAPLGSCATMLFLATTSEVDLSDTGAVLVEQLIQRPPIRERLAAGGADDAIRRLVVASIVHCTNKNEQILQRRLLLISAMNLKEALELPIAVVRGEGRYARTQPMTRAAAILVVGQHGNRQNIDDLAPLMDDTTICMPLQVQVAGRPGANVQLRDVALVVALHLTDQRPADYGYLHARLQPQRVFQLDSLHCENDEQRFKAVKKWRAWRAAEKERESRAAARPASDDEAGGN